jgi:hypothetical protein
VLVVGFLAAAVPAFAGPSAAKVRLGAFLEVPEETLASQLDLPKGRGLVVRQVIADSAAAKAGLQPFDILLELNGQAVPGDVRQFCFAIEQAPDTPITAVVLRKGLKITISDISLPPQVRRVSTARDTQVVAAEIDRELDKRLTEAKVAVSLLADDAEFMRRVYLDITGRIPTVQQTDAFLASKDPAKRRKLIDELLASPFYGQHFATIWDNLLIKREENNRFLDSSAFRSWLATSFNHSAGWDQIVSDMLTAEGPLVENPEGTFFLAHRGDFGQVAPSKVVGTVVNVFMGTKLQCAECHDHPYLKEWKRDDFWGMAAFFSHTRSTGQQFAQFALAGQKGQPGPMITEDDRVPDPFGQIRQVQGRTGPLPGAVIELPDGADPRKKTGKVIKAKFFEGKEPDLPQQGPFRLSFAGWLTSSENRFFAPAAVNRLWAHFFARGFVNPLDDFETGSPSHPELLLQLAKEFQASGFDHKWLIRAICNSQAYQRTSRPDKGNDMDAELFSHQAVKVMSPETLYDSLCLSLGVTDLKLPQAAQPNRVVAFQGGRPGQTVREQFVRLFAAKEAADSASEWTLGVPQILRLMNSGLLNQGGPVIDRVLQQSTDAEKRIEHLYLATLSRRPTPDELEKFSAYVAGKEDAKSAYAGVLWVLLNSAEFVCNR